ncbi:MAG: hypothetical protein IK008_04405 [Bacteroidales bacterium]|nr:hypothetical protein [Bacteroidales bacterium]
MAARQHKAWAAVLGAAVLCVGSCAQREEMPQEQGVRVIHFKATEIRTKAAFGEAENGVRPTLWTSNDTELKLSLNYGSAVAAAVTPSQDHVTASFDASIDFTGITGPYTFYAVSPSSSAKALSPSREAWKVSIPCEQTPSALSADEGAVIIAAASEPFASAASISSVSMSFTHLTAYGRFSLENLSLGEGETVSAVELTVTTPIVGDWYWACAEGEGGHTLTDYGASSTLTINTSSTSDIWFGCAPVSVGDEALVVEVHTNLGVYEQLTAFPEGCMFTAGECAVFSVDMDGADFTAAGSGSGGGTPVTVSMDTFSSISGYVDGDTNISYEATQGDAQTAPVVNGDVIRIYQNGGLLTVSADNGKTITNVTIGSSMATSVQVRYDDGGFGSSNSITANGTYSTGTISASTVVFKCVGTDKSHRLYLNSLSVTYGGSGSGSSGPDPLLSETNYGCYLGTGLEWEYNPGTDQVTRSYDNAGFETYTIINPSTVEELEITGYKKGYVKGDGNIPISVHWRRGATTVLSEDYTMKIIREDGPKVWLSDGTNGVIIKK